MSKPLSPGMQAMLKRTQATHAEITNLGSTTGDQVLMINVEQLVASPFQARLDFSDLDALAHDITKRGVLLPLLARQTPKGLEIIAGERRWRAAKMAEQERVPVIIKEQISDQEARIFGLVENLQRQDLNAYEIACAIVDLVAENTNRHSESVQAALSKREIEEALEVALIDALSVIGKEITTLTFRKHYLPILSLSERLIQAIRGGASFRAVLLLRNATTTQIEEWLPRIENGEWGIRDIEAAKQAARQKPKSHTLQKQLRSIHRLAKPERLEQLEESEKLKIEKWILQIKGVLEGEK